MRSESVGSLASKSNSPVSETFLDDTLDVDCLKMEAEAASLFLILRRELLVIP